MHLLDDLKKIKKLDPKLVLESIELLGEQFNQAWLEAKKIKMPAGAKTARQILLNGMGGSALGAHLIASLLTKNLAKPFTIINSYQVPGWVSQDTLYFIFSYSGDTEEPLHSISQAKKQKARIFGFASGGKLADLIKKGEIPGLIFQPIFNPSGAPRLGIGYSLGLLLGAFCQLGLTKIAESEIKTIQKNLKNWRKDFGTEQPLAKNQAKKLAQKLMGKIPIVVAAEFLAGNAHVLANQFNETAKTFSTYFLISELNHHLLDGLNFPKIKPSVLHFIFLNSNLYLRRNRFRLNLTQEILAKNKVKSDAYQLKSANSLNQIFEALVFGSYASYYLAILNGVSPIKIPWVGLLKSKLKKFN
ncbi:MAG TPA: SIS domain-containing protein [Patescibacteria group bacterium]|nr:SIS domain-containing protein [Patescibacteria group bacterium]